MAFEKELPEWKSPGVEPSASKKNEGWKPGEKPPADWLNWTQNRTYKALEELQNHKHTGAAGDAAKLDSNSLANGAATDAVIGNRTIDDTAVPSTGPNTITGLFGSLGKMTRQITGKSSWITPPATTLEAANTHMNATTGIHGAVSTATPNTLLVRDANGRAQVAAPVAAADIARKDTVDALEAKLKSNQLLTTNLNYGLQTVNADQAGPVDLSARGRSLVNQLGCDGNCEDVSKFSSSQGTVVLDTTYKTVGSSSIKATVTSGGGMSVNYNLNSRLDTTKYYILAADTKNGNATNVTFRFYNGGANVGSTVNAVTTSFSTQYVKIAPVNFGSAQHIYFDVSGANGTYGFVDGIRLYEISAAEYTALGTTLTDINQIAARYPYTEGIANVNGLYVNKSSKNLLPPFNEWTLHANAQVNEPYKLTLNATGSNQYTNFFVNALPNTTYTFNVQNPNSQTVKALFYADATYISSGYSDIRTGGTFTTPSNCNRILVELTNSIPGMFTFTNPMLTIGSTAATFETKSDQYIYVPNQQFASSVDGSVYDTLYKMGNKYYKESRFKTVDLDGSLAWTFYAGHTGYKTVTLPPFSGLDLQAKPDSAIMTKYDGKILKVLNGVVAGQSGDLYRQMTGDPYMYITVSNSDSGFGESYNVTTADIKNYFKGWKLSDNAFGQYSSGTKYYTAVDALKAKFLNKFSGSVVENPHIAKSSTNVSATLTAPSGAWPSEFVGGYANVITLDGVSAISSGVTNLTISQQLFSFNLIEHVIRNYGIEIFGTATSTVDRVTWLKANVGKITCNWWGFGSSVGGNKATLTMWHVVQATYHSALKTTSLGTVTKLSFSNVDGGSPLSSYVDANGFVHFLAYAEASNGTIASTINTDFVDLDVQLLVQTLPSTTYATKNYTPYKLQYQLASSTIEEIAVEGDIALHEGGNQIEVGSGLIVREKATLVNDTTYGVYRLGTSTTKLSKRVSKFLQIYKDAAATKLNVSTFDPNGLYSAYISPAQYDSLADYYATYIALDQYSITSNPTDVSIQYGASMATVVSNLAQDLADNTTKDSVQDWLLLQDGAYLDNLRLDVDTHRNASTAHGATPNAIASTIIQRDANGQANVGTPIANSHIARKQDVDSASNAANAAQTTANSALTRANASLPKDGLEQMTGPLSFSGIARISSPTSFAEIDGKEACYFGSNCYYDTGAWKRHDTSKAACLMEVNYASTSMTRLYVTTAGANPITWSNSSPVWTGSNDGAGSGLDADVLRGFAPFYAATGDTIVTREPNGNINASSYNGYIPTNKLGDKMAGTLILKESTGRIHDISGGSTFEVGSNAGNASYFTLHRHGEFAAYFGLDTDNYLKLGGWSFGNVAYKLWTEQLLRNNGNGTLEWNDSGTWKAVGGVKLVQRGMVGVGGTVDVTITAVNMNKSYLTFPNLRKPQNGELEIYAYLLNSTTVRIVMAGAVGATVSWEVVESY
ncbi:hypothetical protein [Paenibacillus radicis (ex Xue et al. 2023)]|uniref:Uncharacterized protein n=1 Tax=Paenibacillus radicis (ex Xue et al. 2023) TaxID=2972489 RepID=A0ABT1YUI0_9BACL|nr:hypothetical protein [Paenibacillus radicis (ex Xue et al. 2023)]MCR8636193.1 hypothetical protein [Paenibacillus radicis (ex Xue et al. 2023)]